MSGRFANLCEYRPVKWRWLVDREDPRTVLLVSVLILGIGIVMVRSLLDSGLPLAFVVLWFVLSVAQLVRAVLHYRRWRRRAGRQADA